MARDRMTTQVPLAELTDRMNRFRARMDAACPDWQLAACFGRVNQYYFTGTIQDAVLLVPPGGRGHPVGPPQLRAGADRIALPRHSPHEELSRRGAPRAGRPQRRSRRRRRGCLTPLLQRFRKYFPSKSVGALDAQVAHVRAIKSPYEIAILERAGAIHRRALEEQVPALLREGISEAELGCELLALLVREGHQGIARFAMFDIDILPGANRVRGELAVSDLFRRAGRVPWA